MKDNCAHVGADKGDVVDVRELRRSFKPLSLYRGSADDGDPNADPLAGRIGQDDAALDQVDARYIIRRALRALNESE